MKKLLLYTVCTAMACSSWAGIFDKGTPDEQREAILKERERIVAKVIEGKPDVADKIKSAEGYATFDALNVNLLVLATARGKGVLVDNKDGSETFMSVTSIGGGLGAGLKDLRVLKYPGYASRTAGLPMGATFQSEKPKR